MNDNIEVLRGLVAKWRDRDGVGSLVRFDARLRCADELDAALAAMGGQGEACKTCDGRGEIGGHVGQTPEQFDYVSEPCPECAAPQQPEARVGGEVVCAVCEEVVEKIEAGYVPRGHGVYSKPFTTPPPSAVPEGWRPIETAPKDGRDVLTWHSMGGNGAVVNNPTNRHYGKPGYCVIQSPMVIEPTLFYPSEALETGRVTHWMPLPAAPEPGEG